MVLRHGLSCGERAFESAIFSVVVFRKAIPAARLGIRINAVAISLGTIAAEEARHRQHGASSFPSLSRAAAPGSGGSSKHWRHLKRSSPWKSRAQVGARGREPCNSHKPVFELGCVWSKAKLYTAHSLRAETRVVPRKGPDVHRLLASSPEGRLQRHLVNAGLTILFAVVFVVNLFMGLI